MPIIFRLHPRPFFSTHALTSYRTGEKERKSRYHRSQKRKERKRFRPWTRIQINPLKKGKESFSTVCTILFSDRARTKLLFFFPFSAHPLVSRYPPHGAPAVSLSSSPLRLRSENRAREKRKEKEQSILSRPLVHFGPGRTRQGKINKFS